ncbi:MAG: hypothetical protein QG567_701 [Campylobacterota bacterium]|nr:hypothetical protein [Campylobacterota bacterium]
MNVDDITNVGSHHAGIGLTVLGNLKKLHDGKHTLHDFTLNSGEALVSKKVALIAAGKGAALGLHLGPPGALAGFVLGGVLGSSLGSSVVGFFKDAFIYDGIINNCEHYAYSYSPDINNFTELTSKNINKIIQEQEVILNGFNIMKDKITVEKMLPYILIEEMEYFRTYSNEILEEGKNIFINELEVILSKNNIKEDHQDRYIGVALIQHFPKPSGYIASTYVQVNTELYKHKSYPYILQIAHDKMKLLRDLSYQKAMRIAEEDFLQNIEEYVLLQKHPLKFLSWLNVLVFITVILLLVKS